MADSKQNPVVVLAEHTCTAIYTAGYAVSGAGVAARRAMSLPPMTSMDMTNAPRMVTDDWLSQLLQPTETIQPSFTESCSRYRLREATFAPTASVVELPQTASRQLLRTILATKQERGHVVNSVMNTLPTQLTQQNDYVSEHNKVRGHLGGGVSWLVTIDAESRRGNRQEGMLTQALAAGKVPEASAMKNPLTSRCNTRTRRRMKRAGNGRYSNQDYKLSRRRGGHWASHPCCGYWSDPLLGENRKR